MPRTDVSMSGAPDGTYARIYAAVRRIPKGRVASYGQVATLAGLAGHARQVGYALHRLPSATAVPWHRVVDAQGRIAKRAYPEDGMLQRMLLEREGVGFAAAGQVDLTRFAWKPARRAAQRR